MKAMVLAAGFGRRMQPLTLQIPKPAVPVLGRPLIQQVLERLAADRCREGTLNLHHLPGSLKKLLADCAGGGLEAVHLSLEETILGTGGGIRHAAATLRGEGPVLIRNSDFLLDLDLEELVRFHRRSGRPVTLVLARRRDDGARYTPVPVDAAGRVLSFGGLAPFDRSKTASIGTFTGLHLVEEEVLDRIPGPGPCDIVRDVYLPMLEHGDVGAFLTSRFWWEFGTPEAYLEGSLKLLRIPPENARRFCRTDPVRVDGDTRIAVGPGAEIDEDARLQGGVAVGYAAAVGSGCVLEDSMILPEAWIGPGVHLARCVIGPRSEIPSGVDLQDALVCADLDPAAPAPDGCVRKDGLLIRPFRPIPREVGE